MTKDAASTPKTWLERLSHALLREPKDRIQLLEILREAEHQRILDPDALRMIEGVIQVSEKCVDDVMVPRSQMISIEHDAPYDSLLNTMVDSHHSRFPVIGENHDDIIGILLAKDLLRYQHNHPEKFNIQAA